ncbi:fungal chitosanase of glycosyl hydrolase group 75-domain-containing protein [Fusarium avenaceum]|nr:fungal chitosanase of glycosyl hydrolase group 75-domain-containing protein [Fusarium avenaceum]
MGSFRFLLFASVAALVTARDVPDNIKAFKESIIEQGSCNDTLAKGFHSSDGDDGSYVYCGDHLKDYNVIYLQGTKGKLVNMDVDCDGIQGSSADDGRCGSSGDTQSVTSFQDRIQDYGAGRKDLDANIHPYVVFGNVGTKKNWPTFDAQKHGIKPLSIIAVVCGEKMFYGIWGDENGDDGEEAMVGEAAISLATACFGKSINGNNGHDEDDVLYIAFPGSDAVPGEDGADWKAKNFKDFEASLSSVGDELVKRINDTSSGSNETETDDGDKKDDDSGASRLWSGTGSWGVGLFVVSAMAVMMI